MNRHKIQRHPLDPRRQVPDSVGGLADKFYVSSLWRKLRSIHIKEEPFCRYCWILDKKMHKVRKGFIVDHFRPRRLWLSMQVSPSNFVTSCKRHHDIKRAKEGKVRTQSEWELSVYPLYKDCEHRPEKYYYT